MQPRDHIPKPPSNNKKVLVVDDEQVVLELVSQMLSVMGIEAATANNGAQALRLFAATKFDLILTDYVMPDMNGCALAASIKKCSAYTPIILMTGYGETSMQKEIGMESIDCLITKPFRLLEFKAAVNGLLYPDAS